MSHIYRLPSFQLSEFIVQSVWHYTFYELNINLHYMLRSIAAFERIIMLQIYVTTWPVTHDDATAAATTFAAWQHFFVCLLQKLPPHTILNLIKNVFCPGYRCVDNSENSQKGRNTEQETGWKLGSMLRRSLSNAQIQGNDTILRAGWLVYTRVSDDYYYVCICRGGRGTCRCRRLG